MVPADEQREGDERMGWMGLLGLLFLLAGIGGLKRGRGGKTSQQGCAMFLLGAVLLFVWWVASQS